MAGNGQATVSFTAPVSNGGAPITSYTVTSSPGGLTATGSTSPLTVSGLTNGTAYTFTVVAINSAGSSATSTASSSVIPVAPSSGPVIDPSVPASSFIWGVNTASVSFSTICVDNDENVYAAGSVITLQGASIYNYTRVNGTLVEQSLYGILPSETTYFRGQTFIIKYNSYGQVQWVQLITQAAASNNFSNASTFKLVIDNDSNLVLSTSLGYINGADVGLLKTLVLQQQSGINESNIITFDPVGSFTVQGVTDSILVKYNTDGNPIWLTKLNNQTIQTTEMINDIITDSNSNIYVVGQFGGNIGATTNGMMLYNSGIVPGTNTSINCGQYGYLQSPGMASGYIIKYNSDGQVQWVHMLLNTCTTKLYSATCHNIMIDSNDNIIVKGMLSQSMINVPLTNQVQTLSYSTTTVNYTPSLYTFNSIIPGAPNRIQLQLFGQIQFPDQTNTTMSGGMTGYQGATILMKFQPDGTVVWINGIPNSSSTVFKQNAVDSQNNFYTVADPGAPGLTTTPIYSYVPGLLPNGIINFQPTYKITNAVNTAGSVTGSKNIYKFNSEGQIIAAAQLYNSNVGVGMTNSSVNIHCSDVDELIITGSLSINVGTANLRGIHCSQFVGPDATNTFTPQSQLYGFIPNVQDTDIYVIKYNSANQGVWALNINTGTNSGTPSLNDQLLSAYIKGRYLYLGALFFSQSLKLQSFTGINASSIVQQTGSIIMNYNSLTTNNGCLLKYAL